MTSLTDDIAEIKSIGYGKDPLRTIVYRSDTQGKPISHQRLYKKTYFLMKKIKQHVEQFYFRHMTAKGPIRKLSAKQLAKDLGSNEATIRNTILKMSAMRYIMILEDGKWKYEHKSPLLIMQQKPKYTDRRYWGRKTPVYVYPYQTRFIE
ncbi:hypothetical protein H6504_00510 [Candidatus Woesearchaeota archaeon]|nr:hypothetical protein [Candidatus Woesearchaeota archaeon]